MTTTLVPDTTTDRLAIARALVEVEYAEHKAALWRELADFLAEPLALHNLLAAGDHAQRRQREQTLRGIFDEPSEPRFVVTIDRPITEKQAVMIREAVTKDGWKFDEPEHALSDVAPRRGGKYRRTNRDSWYKRLRDAW